MKQLTPINVKLSKDTSGFYAVANLAPGIVSYDGLTSIFATGDSIDATLDELVEAISFALDNEAITISRNDLIIKLDLPSFFEFYKVINVKALSKRLGMNQSLLSQYISGKKKPSKKQSIRILEGIRQLGRELADLDFIYPDH
jgi:hypothetical protein